MGKVLQAVPLRTGLCVDVDLIVHGTKFRKFLEIDLLLMELLAAETWELNIMQRPIQLDAFARADLPRSG